ncbi:type VI secretion system lipoprotein TssJ [Aliamphritea ceti]|uniref:type VI secretion system lipoprotein TssJ n=1 Tax=Aliamphritea ceti TaxID=1524258 RepID=UPI0021C4AE0B|nr:type VI secretion system lipoprotein TssJ [Aliamphritea ceti]
MPFGIGNFCRLFFCTALLFSLVGCFSLEVKEDTPPAATLSLAISAHPLTNLDLSGRPSPTVVRVYQLRKEVDFNEASFFDLYDQDKTLLAADLLSREELVVAPGTVVNRQLIISPDARFVAIMAAFQDTNNSVHKQIQAVSGVDDTTLVAYLSANSLAVTSDGSTGIKEPSLPLNTKIDTQASQGVAVDKDGVSVNPTKLEGCQGAKAINVLMNEGC